MSDEARVPPVSPPAPTPMFVVDMASCVFMECVEKEEGGRSSWAQRKELKKEKRVERVCGTAPTSITSGY